MTVRSAIGNMVIAFVLVLGCTNDAIGQRAVVRWAYGPFGTPGDAAYAVDNGRIHQACGSFAELGPCIWLYGREEVFHASNAGGSKGSGGYVLEGNRFFRCEGAFCNKGPCLLIVERNKVFRADGAFCNKGSGAFVIDGDTVYLAEGPFANKGDALFQLEGDVPLLALLTILAGY